MNKRGQSEVITTVLIILLVLVAVFIVYVAVRNMVKGGTEQASTAPLDVSLTSSSTNLSLSLINVSVSRGAGEGNISEIKIIFKDSAGAEVCRYENTTDLPGELETRVYYNIACPVGAGTIRSYDVYPIIKLGSREVVGLKAANTASNTPASTECNPNANEICDGIDNNCNLQVDENCYCSSLRIKDYCNLFDGDYNNLKACQENGCITDEIRWCSGADINHDGKVDSADGEALNDSFGNTGCSEPGWCNNADVNKDGEVSFADETLMNIHFGDTGCNLPENWKIDCYSDSISNDNANKTSCEKANKTSCEIVNGCSWQKSECTLDSDCPDKNCYNRKCENRKCNYTFSNNPGCIGCGTIISQDNTVLLLNNSLNNCETFGIMINARNVTIDCQRHEITGVSNSRNYNSSGKEDCSLGFVLNQEVYPGGIIICRYKGYNYQVKNCIIHDFLNVGQYGGAITNYNQHPSGYTGLIKNNYIYNSERGIMQWGEFETIEGNTFEGCNTGIWLDESSGNIVKNNTFKNCNKAIDHYCGPYCDYKESPTNITENTFINIMSSSMQFETRSHSLWSQTPGFIRNNIVKNNLTGNSIYQVILGVFIDDNVNLYFKDNILNNTPLNPLLFFNESQISQNPF